VRYVSVIDNIDTGIESSINDITPFKAILNDMYAKDISKKIQAIFKDKMQKGEYLGSRIPFGYKKSETDKNKLEIDKRYAPYIKFMFEKYLEGLTIKLIAYELSKMEIPTPATIHKLKLKQTATSNLWKSSVVERILKNEVYIGNTIQNVTKKVNYKSKIRIQVPKEQRIKVENTHPEIIDKETFEAVQMLMNKTKRVVRNKIDSCLRGLIYCADCKHRMQVAYGTARKDKTKITRKYYRCSISGKYGELYQCSSHYIREEIIIEAVKDTLKKVCFNFKDKTFLQEIAKKQFQLNLTENQDITVELNKLKNEIIIANKKLDMLYIDKLDGKIIEVDFQRIYQNFQEKRDVLQEKIETLNSKIGDNKTLNIEKINKLIDNFFNAEELNMNLVYEIINRIEVTNDKKLHIYFNFKELELCN